MLCVFSRSYDHDPVCISDANGLRTENIKDRGLYGTLLYLCYEVYLCKFMYICYVLDRRVLAAPVLIKLHWLPIKFRIQVKVLLLVYKALNGLAPKYIKELLVPYKPRRHLRSEAKGLLDEPRTRLKFGDRAFSISAPRLWNALSQHLKDSTSCQAFKRCLKTHLFRLAH